MINAPEISIKYRCQRTIQAALLAPRLRSLCQLFHSRTQYQRGWSCAPADTSAATTARAATACAGPGANTSAPAAARRSAPSWWGRATAAPPPTASSGAPSKVRSRCSVICNIQYLYLSRSCRNAGKRGICASLPAPSRPIGHSSPKWSGAYEVQVVYVRRKISIQNDNEEIFYYFWFKWQATFGYL